MDSLWLVGKTWELCIDFLRHNYKFTVGNNEPYGVNNNDDYIISKFEIKNQSSIVWRNWQT